MRSRCGSGPSCCRKGPAAKPKPKRRSKLKPEQAADPVLARKAALDLLARREHSELELCRKLGSRGFDADIIETTVAVLVAERLLSNTRFVDAFIHSRYQRGTGPQKIQAELRARGLDETLISHAIAEFEAQWPDLARQVREKRFGTSLPTDFKDRSRQMRFLQQRGFTSEQISGLFRESE